MSTVDTPAPVAPSATAAVPEDEVVAFLHGRSAPCPRCGYELRDLDRPQCPECGEPLVLKVGSPRSHFGWLIVAMAPGCFSGVAAVLLFVPVYFAITQHHVGHPGMPYPIPCADAFGFASAASLLLFYRKRHRIMAWRKGQQVWLAAGVWGAHILAFVLFVLGMLYF